ncbi:MAG: hypothetical protein JXA67_16500 [Micromonosporaceae bacterium]|nr:hypothetical protein [Micromonosporaceae bacterium]
MSRKHLFVTDAHGRTTVLPADPAHLRRQIRDHQAAGRSAMILDDDDRIRFGLLTQRLLQERR